MNAAFLLVTGAMLVGQGDKKPAPPAAAPAASAACTSCNDSCGCESWGHRLRDRLQGLFNRDNCDSCQPTTCHEHTPWFHRSGCDDCGRAKLCQPACREPKCCTPAPTCNDSCGCGHPGFLSKLRERFGRNECCDGGCSGGGCGAAAAPAPMKAGEKIDVAPKKMPPPPVDAPKKTTTEVRIETPPAPIAAPNAIQPLPTPPAVEITPVPIPRVEGDRRDPF